MPLADGHSHPNHSSNGSTPTTQPRSTSTRTTSVTPNSPSSRPQPKRPGGTLPPSRSAILRSPATDAQNRARREPAHRATAEGSAARPADRLVHPRQGRTVTPAWWNSPGQGSLVHADARWDRKPGSYLRGGCQRTARCTRPTPGLWGANCTTAPEVGRLPGCDAGDQTASVCEG